MQQSPPTPENDRKDLARRVALAQYDLDRAKRSETLQYQSASERLRRLQAALALHDERHPAAALSALLADGPNWNANSYERRRAELQTKIARQPRPTPPASRTSTRRG